MRRYVALANSENPEAYIKKGTAKAKKYSQEVSIGVAALSVLLLTGI